MRNLKDTAVSMYKMLRSFKIDPFQGNFSEMVDLFLEDKTWYGAYWTHIDQYTALSNIHLIHYESLLKVSWKVNIFF